MNEKILEITNIRMKNDWTTPRKIRILKENEPAYIDGYSTITATYDKEVNETYIRIETEYKKQCVYCAHGTCILENISCDGFTGCFDVSKDWYE